MIEGDPPRSLTGAIHQCSSQPAGGERLKERLRERAREREGDAARLLALAGQLTTCEYILTEIGAREAAMKEAQVCLDALRRARSGAAGERAADAGAGRLQGTMVERD